MKSADLPISSELQGSPFEHVRPLARGGMGEVHVVRHRETGALRVMKIVRALEDDVAEDITKRTLAEGRLLRGLSHPNIVELIDLGRTNSGKPYLVTELLQGRTLKEEVVARGALPWAEVARVLDQVLAGLEAAHRQGIVHRDVKPLNLFASDQPDGRRVVKILDFGIAKALSHEAAERAGSGLVATREGFFVGSPAHMSPEQALGGAVDARSDLYSLGTVAWFLLTGRVLFANASHELILLAHLRDQPPSLRASLRDVPVALDDLLQRALAKAPADRFESARAMREALAPLLRPAPSRVAPGVAQRGTVRMDIPPGALTPGPTPRPPSRPEKTVVLDVSALQPDPDATVQDPPRSDLVDTVPQGPRPTVPRVHTTHARSDARPLAATQIALPLAAGGPARVDPHATTAQRRQPATPSPWAIRAGIALSAVLVVVVLYLLVLVVTGRSL